MNQIRTEQKKQGKQIFFRSDFVYGLVCGVLFFSILLIIFKGFTFTLYNLQIRIYHVTYLCLIYLVTYYKLSQSQRMDDRERFISAYVFVLFVWEIHDTLSTFIGINQGIFYFFDVTRLAPTDIIVSIWMRNLTIMGMSLFYLRGKLKMNWKIVPLIILQILLWTWIAFQPNDVSFTDPINLTLDYLPYYLMLK